MFGPSGLCLMDLLAGVHLMSKAGKQLLVHVSDNQLRLLRDAALACKSN